MTALLVVASVAVLFFLCRSVWLEHRSHQIADRRADALHVLGRLTGSRRRVRPLAAPDPDRARRVGETWAPPPMPGRSGLTRLVTIDRAEPDLYEADLEELLEADDEPPAGDENEAADPTNRLVFDDFALSEQEALEWNQVPTVSTDLAYEAEDEYRPQTWAGPPPAPPPMGVLDPPAPAPHPEPVVTGPADWVRWAAAGAVAAGVLVAVVAPFHTGSGHHRLVIVPASRAQPPAVAPAGRAGSSASRPVVRRAASPARISRPPATHRAAPAQPAPATTVAPATVPVAAGPGPSLSRLSPASGRAGQTITMYGSNLFSASGAIGVTFGGASGYVSCPVRTTCQAVVPPQPGPTATVPVVVTTDSGRTRPLDFTYRAA